MGGSCSFCERDIQKMAGNAVRFLRNREALIMEHQLPKGRLVWWRRDDGALSKFSEVMGMETGDKQGRNSIHTMTTCIEHIVTA